MRRREFIAGLGGAAVWPLATHAQQPALPVIGFLGTSSLATMGGRWLLDFKRGLAETGYVEDRNVAIEYRWADDHYDRLPALAAELVRRRVTVIAAPGGPAAIAAPVHNDAEIEAVITSLGREPRGGLVVTADGFNLVHREAIISLAAQNHVAAIYAQSVFVRDGGLLSYGPDVIEIYRRSASYVDRILRGAKPADLPVQLPIKFETALNSKTAKTLGLAVPQSILLLADEVIE
jgi:ABC-type uncharacterized transport system substrate-binding protein